MDENRRSSARIRNLESERTNRQRPSMEEEESSPVKRRTMKKRQVVKVNVGSEVVEIGVGKLEAVEIGVGKSEMEVKNSEDKTGVEVKKSNDKKTGEMVGSDENAVVGGEKSAYARVLETLRSFNKHYLHFVQEEEKRCGSMDGEKKKAISPKKKNGQDSEENKKSSSRRPDLKAVNKMRLENDILYPNKRIGSIPGVDVGHQFFSRCEMVSVGFHSHWLSGIDYIGSTAKLKEFSGYKLPLAVAIVMSGQYEDDLDNSDEVVYTGQGGNNLLGNKRQISDQAMVRGNLGLKNCMDQAIPIRVIRGHQSKSSYVGKVYTYDGLYKVTKYWAEKGVSGFLVYKFGLKRLEGQPSMTTDQVRFSRGQIPNSISEIRGLVCEDISGGLENIPIPATNTVDDPPVPPTGLTYLDKIQISKSVKCPVKAPGCDCNGYCVDPKRCACARLNGSDFPYVHRDGGRLVEPKDVVFECGPNCGCGPECVNRTSQKGIRYRFEVYKTPKKGWAVRSWDYIPAGALICEYIGKLMKTEEVHSVPENNYAFDIDCRQTIKGLDGRERRSRAVSIPSYLEKDVDPDKAPEFCLDAGDSGNFARYINHSCQPNLFVQCVLSTHHDIDQARLVLFAADNIPPLKELTYDYGYAIDSIVGPDGEIKQLPCFCGAADCRKRMF